MKLQIGNSKVEIDFSDEQQTLDLISWGQKFINKKYKHIIIDLAKFEKIVNKYNKLPHIVDSEADKFKYNTFLNSACKFHNKITNEMVGGVKKNGKITLGMAQLIELVDKINNKVMLESKDKQIVNTCKQTKAWLLANMDLLMLQSQKLQNLSLSIFGDNTKIYQEPLTNKETSVIFE